MYAHLWQSLLDWYDREQRDLPWRRTRDAYPVLVSETMLQQTGVERVIPKYLCFLEQWPALAALAAASTADVIRMWSGLGYNRRAVWLQQAAQLTIERWGELPATIDELETLPGVGPYTARAVACFSFGVQTAVLDTNVKRVLSRVLLPADTVPSSKGLWALAGEVLPPGRAYNWNQGLMDLGATVCTHEAPRCLLCPLSQDCRAYPWMAAPAGRRSIAETRPQWKEGPFVGSRRYYRGRIVEILRGLAADGGIALPQLGAAIKVGFEDADLPWLHGLLADLERDGLLTVEGGLASLPH